jgi:hypothetical protein
MSGSNSLSVPPPSASGSLDLSSLAKPTSSGTGLFESPASRYDDAYDDRKYAQESDCMLPLSSIVGVLILSYRLSSQRTG